MAHWRDETFALLLLTTVKLAAAQFPEELRKALASVFDLSAVEDMAKRVMIVASSAQAFAQQAQELCLQVHRDLENLEKEIDELRLKLGEVSPE